jgi:hydroxyacylglutathione hydrolase
MFIKQLYTNCLAEAAYYIESEGQAAVIDPIRETDPYVKLASERNAKIRYVFETHFHADFISGHIDLAEKTGASIVYGPNAETGYKVHQAKDGEEFKIGKLTIRVLHTPGHTLESSCYLLLDENGKEHCIFTGDTLFVGDVGRPDLLDGVMSKEELAAMMFESLNGKIKKLPDDVIVYPAHGPGSACGKNIGKETWSTIGNQKKNNYALLETDKDKFIETLITGLTPPPMYFFEDARINKTGYENVEVVVSRNMKPLTVQEAEKAIDAGALVLDTRLADEYETASIPGSQNIGLNGSFAGWVGTLLHIEQPLVLVTDKGRESETILRLSRVGYENVMGYLDGGMDAWMKAGRPILRVPSVGPEALVAVQQDKSGVILDVRKDGEYENGFVKDATHISLAELSDKLESLDRSSTYYVHCQGGYRSMMACSMMKAKGFDHVINVHHGFSAMKDIGLNIEIPLAV